MEWQFAAVFLALILGALTQSSTGVGMGLVAAPIMAIVDPSLVPGPILLLAAVLSLFTFVRDRSEIEWWAFWYLLAGRIPAAVIAAFIASALSERLFLIVFALLILLAIASSLQGRVVERTNATMLGAGAASGLMGTITGVGAPPIAIVFQNASGPMARATLGMYFFVGAMVSVGALWMLNGNAIADIAISLKLLPAVLIGYLVSYPARSFVDAGRMKPIILTICGLAAIILLVKAAMA